MKDVEICPSILSADFLNMKKDLDLLKAVGVRILHVDVMDGYFVLNISFGVDVVRSLF